MGARLSKAEMAYAAGLIDGEGCIAIRYTYTPPKPDVPFGRERFYMSVTMGNTNEKLVRFLCDRWGGSISFHAAKPDTNRKAHYQYVIAAQKAAVLLRDVQPYVVAKHRQLRLALQFQEYMSGGRGFGTRRSDARIAKYRRFRDAMNVLNGKGLVRKPPVNRAYASGAGHANAPADVPDYHLAVAARARAAPL